MKTTKYIFLALLAALLLLVPNNGRAQNTNTLTVQTDGSTILGLDCSDPTNDAAIMSLLFTSSSIVATETAGEYTFSLTCNTNIDPNRITFSAFTPAGGATLVSGPTISGQTITYVINNAAPDATVHTLQVTGYTPHGFTVTVPETYMGNATHQCVKLTIIDDVTSTTIVTGAEYDATSVTNLFDVAGDAYVTHIVTMGSKTVTLTGKAGTLYYGNTVNANWNPITKVNSPSTGGVVTNEGSYPLTSTATGLTGEFQFDPAYYAGLAEFTFKSAVDALTEFGVATTLDKANNKVTFNTIGYDGLFMTPVMTFTPRELTNAFVSAGITGYDTMDGDVFVYYYTGSPITPIITVTDADRGSYALVPGTDYTASGDLTKTDVTSTDYTITLTGGGHNYDGTRDIKWRIAKSINAGTITVAVDPVVYQGAEYDLAAVKTKVVVKDGATELVEGTDYELTLKAGHQEFTNAKTYVEEIVITGKGSYAGVRYADFTISPLDIASATITGNSIAHDGTARTKDDVVALIGVKVGTKDQAVTVDYNIAAVDQTYQDAKTYANAITLTAIEPGNLTGSKTIDFIITGGTDINDASIIVTVDPATYNGAAQTPTVKVSSGGTDLMVGTDYEVTYGTGTCKDAKTYAGYVIITGKGIYSGTRYADFTINPKDISLCDVTATAAYTGSDIDPAKNDGGTPPTYDYITVKDGANTLVATVDYTVAVKTDTYKNAGTYDDAITITAVAGGNYTGSKVVDFIISGGTGLDDAKITITVDPVVYKGAEYTLDEVKAKVKVVNTATSYELVEGTDYVLSKLSTYLNAKTYTNDLVIEGQGEYYGKRYADFIVNPKDFQLCSIVASAAYTGTAIPAADIEANTPTVYVIVKDGATTLAVTTDYTIDATTSGFTYQDAGTYTKAIKVTAVAGGNYTGFQDVDFVIDNPGFDVSKALVVAKDVYTGSALPPFMDGTDPTNPANNIVVTLGGTELVYNTDYTFVKNEADDYYKDAKTYENAITITGKGKYFGTVTSTYVIQPRAFDDPKITIYVDEPTNLNELNYNNTDQDLSALVVVRYDGNDPIPATNYLFTPATVREAGVYKISFEGKYNLTGTKEIEVKVKKELDGAYTADFEIKLDPDEQPVILTGANVEPVVVVTDNGKVLEKDKDYTVTFTNNTAEGTGTATIDGIGVYSGQLTYNFSIIAAYFTEGDFAYHALSSSTVALGTEAHTVATTSTAKAITVPATVTHNVGGTDYTFNVIGVEQGAFQNLTTMFTLTLPASIKTIEDKAFEGCSALRWIDAHTADDFTPSSLDRTIDATPFYGVPAQALIFLTDNTVEGENYIYYVNSSEYRCAEFKIYDDVSGTQNNFATINGVNGYEWAYENPYEFKANKVTNTRQFTGNQHYTTCLPYPLAIPANMKAYQLEASSNNTTGDDLVGFTEVSGTLQAFQPYVLVPTNSGQQLSAGETVVPTTVGVFDDTSGSQLNKTPASTVGDYYLYGTMRFRAGDGKQYIMQDKNVWKLTDGAGWNGGTGACILPMRAYIAKDGEAAVKPYLNANYTAIELNEIFDEIQPADNTDRYDLSGRKVTNGNLRKGIYIVNGKKVVMGK